MASIENDSNQIEVQKNFMFWKFQITIVLKANELIYHIVGGTAKIEDCTDADKKAT